MPSYAVPLRHDMLATIVCPFEPGRTWTSFAIEKPYGIFANPNVAASNMSVQLPLAAVDVERRQSPKLVAAYTLPCPSKVSRPIVVPSSSEPPTLLHVEPASVERSTPMPR